LPDCLPCRASFFVETIVARNLQAIIRRTLLAISAARLPRLRVRYEAAAPKYNLNWIPSRVPRRLRSARPGVVKRREEARFKSEPQYASGWRDGYDVCRKYQATEPALSSSE